MDVFAAAEALLRMDRYPDPCCSELTKAIAGAEGLPESFVLCGNGASELIYAFCRAEEPETALIPVPAFSEYEQALRACGAKVSFFETEEKEGSPSPPDCHFRHCVDPAVIRRKKILRKTS